MQHRGSSPSLQNLSKILERAQIRLEPGQLQRLWDYHNLIRRRNEDRELTRIINFEAMAVKHYIDCMIVGDIYQLPSPLMDLGSGAGFPGIPLKIRYPKLEMVLAEPRPKRIEFLNEAIRVLHLDKTKVFEHKVVSESFNEPVAAVISRAVEEIPKTLLRCLGAARQGTKIIFMKGPQCEAEMKEARIRLGRLYEPIFDEAYTLPHSTHHRRLIVYERTDREVTRRGESTKTESHGAQL